MHTSDNPNNPNNPDSSRDIHSDNNPDSPGSPDSPDSPGILDRIRCRSEGDGVVKGRCSDRSLRALSKNPSLRHPNYHYLGIS